MSQSPFVDEMQQDVPLPAPLRVGAGTFGAGVKMQTAQRSIDRLWREYMRLKRTYEPGPTREQVENLRAMLAEDAKHEEQSDDRN